ncbi:hypothetical protein HYG86_06005 [Alkalicella caledoniensis]|uniref:Uncharacterized protein n=1 Tax=Alkalicella caledoniensis TaxID=2731377 RepID=A0A7G9W6P6_ALKCA|nr:hypothetical protein [Alkalicella caledoniensis]QNO14358.1 hypothetical protein HYG86_06005 [Alkalicella caledoniensis]
MPRVSKEDYGTIVKIYNESGNKAAMEYITNEYGIKAPNGVLYRIKKSPGYTYDEFSNKIVIKDEEEPLFMGIDEICNKQVSKEPSHTIVHQIHYSKETSLDLLYKELLQEKLLELSKYIRLDRITNTIDIDKTSILTDGYHIKIY